jgi:hypothetical protein
MVAIVLLVGSAAVAWWAVGDVSEPDGYMQIMPAVSLTSTQTTVAGLAGLGGVAAAGWWLLGLRRRGVLPAAGRKLAVTAVAAGVATACAGRVLTAMTAGANIGGGLLMLVAPFVGIAVAVTAVRQWRAIGHIR